MARDDVTETTKQETVQTTAERTIDEFGESDEWNCGGVYDPSGEFDLDATTNLLADRTRPVLARLPDAVGEYDRQPSRTSYSARYRQEGTFEGHYVRTVSQRTVRVFPVGPYLHCWTVSIEEQYPETDGWGSWLHSDATKHDEIGAAVATALAVMREEINSR